MRENRLRRMADRQGLTLSKNRRRDPRALDYGQWTLTTTAAGEPVLTGTLDDVENYLTR